MTSLISNHGLTVVWAVDRQFCRVNVTGAERQTIRPANVLRGYPLSVEPPPEKAFRNGMPLTPFGLAYAKFLNEINNL